MLFICAYLYFQKRLESWKTSSGSSGFINNKLFKEREKKREKHRRIWQFKTGHHGPLGQSGARGSDKNTPHEHGAPSRAAAKKIPPADSLQKFPKVGRTRRVKRSPARRPQIAFVWTASRRPATGTRLTREASKPALLLCRRGEMRTATLLFV